MQGGEFSLFGMADQGFIQDFRFGGETQHLGGSGGHVPPGKCQIMSILNGFLGGDIPGLPPLHESLQTCPRGRDIESLKCACAIQIVRVRGVQYSAVP